MAEIDITIVREYFELNGFFVRQWRKPPLQKRSKKMRQSEEEVHLMIDNPNPQEASRDLNFMLFANELPYINRAIVFIKGWQTTRFNTATLKSGASILSFLEKEVVKKADEYFSIDSEEAKKWGPLKKILILPVLPMHEPQRSQSVDLLMKHGVHAVISFRSILQDLVSKVAVNHNYEKSDFLQTLRILKNYDMIQSPQMELFSKKR